MAIPKAVQEAADRAEQLMQQQAGKRQAPATEVAKPVAESPAPVQNTAPPAAPPADEDVRLAIPGAPESKGDDWEHKYRVLQGKYNHEVPRLNGKIRELEEGLKTMREEVDRVRTAPATQTPAPAAVRPEEIEQYGPELIDLVTRVAKSVAPAPAQKADTSSIEQSVAETREIASAALRRQFFNDLTAAVPNWETLNTDSGFLKWLDTTDRLADAPRQQLFDDAVAKLDVRRVAAFFNAFTGNVGAAPMAAPPREVVPTTMRGGTELPTGKRIWSQRDIGSFYNNLREGRINPEEAAMTERDIFAAQREGRVR